MLTDQQLKRLHEAAQAAVRLERLKDVPAALLVAQWAVESGWGFAQPGSNCFGIKNFNGSTGRQLLRTREWFTDDEAEMFLKRGDSRTCVLLDPEQVNGARRAYVVRDWFATFPSLEDCFTKRAALFFQGRYGVFAIAYKQDRNVEACIRGIAPIYATAPDYADALLGVIRRHEVVDALDAARNEKEIA